MVSKSVLFPLSEYSYFNTLKINKLINKSEVELKNDFYDLYKEIKVDFTRDYLRESFKTNSEDTAYMLFRQYFPICYFQKKDNINEFILEHISKLAKSFICHRNGIFALKYWSNDNDLRLFGAFDGLEKVELWNSFSRIFCVDILICKYLIDNGMDEEKYLYPYNWIIQVGDIQIQNILEKGVAENHIHINAGFYFNIFWESLRNDDLSSFLNKILKRKKSIYFKNKIKAVVIIRELIICFLRKNIAGFNEFYENLIGNNSSFESEDKKILEIIIEKIVNGKEIEFDIDDKLIKKVTDKWNHSDFIRDNDLRESIVVFRSLKYIIKNQDRLFSDLFWQYIRIKNTVYEEITQNDYMEGLDYFTDFYDRGSKLSIKNQLEVCIETQILSNQLKKLEIRMMPSIKTEKIEIKKDIISFLQNFFCVYLDILEKYKLNKSISIPTMGIVFSMVKRDDDTYFEKCWRKDKDYKDYYKRNYFYGHLQQVYLDTVDIINEIREDIPDISNYIVGIDASAKENSVEPWVFAPVYKKARDSSNNKIINIVSGKSIKNLGFTFHVGEEYRHLLTGLRMIDEVVENFKYHAGDRIGHGTALGIEVESWTKENPIVVMPRIEYIENLLWIWGLCYNGTLNNLNININSFESEVMKHSKEIFETTTGISMYTFWSAYKSKFELFKPDIDKYVKQDCVYEEEQKIWNEELILHSYHCKCYLEKMYEIIQVKITENDIFILKTIQTLLREKIGREGIVIETNPTSNLAISGIERLFKHHIMNLNSYGLEEGSCMDKGVIVTVNSDDPSIFNTTVSNEISYIFYLLQNKGYSRDAVFTWIDKIREWGMITSFVDSRELSRYERIEEIEEIIKNLR